MGYYFIGIGGSGAKAMESLAHLTAAGLMPNKEKQGGLYFMAIDPDFGNGNLNRTKAVLTCIESYQAMKAGNMTPLMKTEIKMSDPFIWSPTEQDKTLDDIMNYQVYKGNPVGKLYETLYTAKERNTMLNEGFRGRPSIGAAVMAKKVTINMCDVNDIEDDRAWKNFVKAVEQDAKAGNVARIFLAGSVFGGTGAAGMPTIARLLRRLLSSVEKNKLLIGGVMILPFFAFSPSAEEQAKGQLFASSANFLTNTKAALKYYASTENPYNAMYLIGDDVLSPVANFSVGAANQNNDAHIIDFYSALAAIDFYQKESVGRNECAYISRSEENIFQWADIPDVMMEGESSSVRVKNRFAQFARFIFGYVHLVKPVLDDLAAGRESSYKYPWFHDFIEGLDVKATEVTKFNEYAESFARWLKQLESSETSRSINFIRQSAFDAEPARVAPGQFAKLSYDEDSDVTMSELWYRLCEGDCGDKENSSGFGKFLRLLYDCCEKKN
ncbi:MAG: hypothetical protein IJT82_00750 [Schwartzia sp.]|nr:hypothetical protein [Schwartzia sp. (in: firmicutes)]